jgi:hypothetical protein
MEPLVALENCDYISPSALLAKKFMIDNGWCPVRAGRFVESNHIEDIYRAAAVKSLTTRIAVWNAAARHQTLMMRHFDIHMHAKTATVKSSVQTWSLSGQF